MLSDWDIYRSDPAVIAAIEPITPIQGPGSLRLGKPTTITSARVNVVSKGGTYAPVGLLRGALAGIFQIPTSFTYDYATVHYVGIAAVQSARDMLVVATSCYVLHVTRNTTTTMSLSLRRYTNGLFWPSQPTPIWSAALTPPVPLGTNFTLEFEWEVSSEYGGTRLIVRKGTATNYSDLATLVDMIHPLDPLPASSLGEGPYLLAEGNNSVNFTCLIDQWRLRA